MLRAFLAQWEPWMPRAWLAQWKLWTLQTCRARAVAQSHYNKRENHRPSVSAGTARSSASLLRRKTCKAKLPVLLFAFSSS